MLQALGAAVLGIGIFVFVNMSPEAGGSVVMAFAHVFGEATRPSLFRAAMFLVVSGVAIIIYGVTSMMSVWKKSVKFMGLVSNWVRVRKGAGHLFCIVIGFGDRTLALAFSGDRSRFSGPGRVMAIS